ncbi:hypothetical protein [Streptomyces sp. AVP053U2]|uniref:hypothetical protein n=1 Tax=Streptomyces sp. AVP053U2 TaxID=1737066 RepID=UPI000A4EC29E
MSCRRRGEVWQAPANRSAAFWWTKKFTGPRLCAAIVETGTDSCRLARTKAQAERSIG